MIYMEDFLLQSFKKIKRSDHLAVSLSGRLAITQVEVKAFGRKKEDEIFGDKSMTATEGKVLLCLTCA